MYAVVRTGGKQYRVEEGRSVTVERLPGEAGDAIELDDVLLMDDGSAVTVGTPVIQGARVLGTIAEQGRAAKIVVFRYKAKTRSRKKTGHRQPFTKLTVEQILAPGEEPRPKQPEAAPEVEAPAAEAPKGRRRRRAGAETAPTAEVASPPEDEAAVAGAEAPATDETPAPAAEKPRRTRRKAE